MECQQEPPEPPRWKKFRHFTLNKSILAATLEAGLSREEHSAYQYLGRRKTPPKNSEVKQM
eukprot:6311845-Amphidinium_carterae.1